ncbi:hypothetical protein A3A69_00505 [candidate division WWE3 bacterium RIFCSPLOWO2_01_FULL_37_15]|uniref:Methyltransferase domain-containing protein n=1 Tax=candidate division WWE3 bacterium RIFCSPLOWO2_01_FULL_37_15 TaxID=1802622 RepID=A0A1F4UUL2_UNCKA|nr:MAG: hypothetical protein A3A69_00505 [candidate division WWE3 bacterium RIFCSPLOWO2_01_FULL_37_15]
MSVFDYFRYKVIFDKETPHNTRIQVISYLGMRKMTSEGITQSYYYKNPLAKEGYWKKAANIVKAQAPNAQNILFLGLGGGTAVHYVSKDNPNAKLVCIEIDEAVIEACQKYFDTDKINSLRIINADAFEFLTDPQKFGISTSFDAIFADLFRGLFFVKIPDFDLFLKQLKSLTNKNGLILFNYTFKKGDEAGVQDFMQKIKEVFGNAESEILRGRIETDNHLIYSLIK